MNEFENPLKLKWYEKLGDYHREVFAGALLISVPLVAIGIYDLGQDEFKARQLSEKVIATASGDVNKDGKLDFVVLKGNGEVWYYETGSMPKLQFVELLRIFVESDNSWHDLKNINLSLKDVSHTGQLDLIFQSYDAPATRDSSCESYCRVHFFNKEQNQFMF